VAGSLGDASADAVVPQELGQPRGPARALTDPQPMKRPRSIALRSQGDPGHARPDDWVKCCSRPRGSGSSTKNVTCFALLAAWYLASMPPSWRASRMTFRAAVLRSIGK